ncbi:MAG: xanthine dehydrogenase family protein subunit M [Thiobacillaceae bacterium]
MIPSSFEYHVPSSVSEAVGLLAQFGGNAKVLAGGHSLLPMMKLRFAGPEHLVDLNRIDSMRGIREENGIIKIGAMALEHDLINSPLLRDKVPLLPEAARQIADPQVRNRGTIGGDIAHGDPANDHPAIAIALDATFVLEGPKGRRTVKAEKFFHGFYMTELAEDELLVEIQVAAFPSGTGWAYEKLKRKTGDWATAAAAVLMRQEAGEVSAVRIALTNVAPTALRAEAAEQALLGKALSESTIQDAMEKAKAICEPAEDLRGDVEYKTAMTGEMLRRALMRAAERCR